MLAVSWWGEERGWIYSQYNEASSGVIIFFIFTLGNHAVTCCCFHVRLELMAIFLSHRKVFYFINSSMMNYHISYCSYNKALHQ